MDKQSERGEEYLQPLWSRAGTACRLREENMEAVGFFLRAGDYSAAYQTLNPWTGQYLLLRRADAGANRSAARRCDRFYSHNGSHSAAGL